MAGTPKRRVPSRLERIRARHWNRFLRALKAVRGGSTKTDATVRRLVNESKELEKNGKLNKKETARLAKRFIEQATIMADNFKQAGIEKGVKFDWANGYNLYLTNFESIVPKALAEEIKRRTMSK